MMLQFSNGRVFATGVASYSYRPARGEEKYPRIHLDLRLGNVETSGFVDTGGVFLLCSPEIGKSMQLSPENALGQERISWRGNILAGTLHRIPITFLAEAGEDLVFEVTAFVPRLTADQEWIEGFPLILGMHGCLEFMRFAIDPTDDTFYFGELGQSDE